MSIYKIPGGEIQVGTLPSGDLTVKGFGCDAAIVQARSIAGQHFGRWEPRHQNWIVPARNSISLKRDLAAKTSQVS